MILDTKQFCKCVRAIVKKHNAKVRARYTFGQSGDTKMFTTFGKRKISFNCIGTKKQFNLIRKDLVKLFKGTWQQNFVKYKWFGNNGSKSIEMHKEDEVLLTDARIEGTCIYKDMTQDKWKEHIKHKLKEIMWNKALLNNNTL